jgi:hypothetical protein
MGNITITLRVIKSKLKEAESTRNGLYVWDADLKGFGVRISNTGRVTWLAQKAIGRGAGSTQRIVLGHYPALSLDDARKEAGQTITRLMKGEDVLSTRASVREAKREEYQSPTVKEASDRYLGQRRSDKRRSHSSRYEDEVRKLFERMIVPELGASKRVQAVTKADIRGLLNTRKEAGHFTAARNLFAQLRPFFDWCVHEEYLTISPCVGVVPPNPSDERSHKLNDVEIVALWSASQDVNLAGPYFRMLLLTAQRRTEVAV